LKVEKRRSELSLKVLSKEIAKSLRMERAKERKIFNQLGN